MQHRTLISALLCAAAAGCHKSPSRSEASAPQEPKFEIPFERFDLENGLRVLMHQDKSDPVVAMATVVHVGSAREEIGRTGFAHFFEHMSFNNSENVPMGANRKMIEEWGGYRNGGTWEDGTIFYEVVPKDAFEKLMWIDSDRFGFMINTVTEPTLEREKQVVKNEKRQFHDNRAYGHSEHAIRKALYPAGHPYSWTTIGDLDDLQAATLDDVRGFYDKYYVPANATLVIAGDIDYAETKTLVSNWFGEIKAGTPPPDLKAKPAALDATQKLFHLDNFAEVAELKLTFPTVDLAHRDHYALEALASVLSQGKRAPLFKYIVEDAKLSSSVSATQDTGEVAGSFTITVRANPGVDLDDVMNEIEKAMRAFETEGVGTDDLKRFKAKNLTEFYSGLESVLARAMTLGEFEEFRGGAEALLKEPEHCKALSKVDVVRVYETYV